MNHPADRGLSSHTEIDGNPGFTGEIFPDRVKAVGGAGADSEIITFNAATASAAIESWLNTAYHRMPLTDPDAYEFGIGIVNGTAVLDMAYKPFNMEKEQTLSVYPYDGQTGVPIGFYGHEIPDPLEEFNIQKSGYIISLQSSLPVGVINAVVTDSTGGEIPLYHTPGSGLIYPAYELSYDEKYKVSVDYLVNHVKYNKTWSFRTQSLPKYLESNGIKINGKYIPKGDVFPRNVGGSIFIPLRGVFERLNAKIEWEPATQTVKITKQNRTIKLAIGSKNAFVDNKQVYFSNAPFLISGTTYVPLRFISESIGAKVGWDNHNKIVNIDVDLGEPIKLTWSTLDDITKIDNFAKPVKEIAKEFDYTVELELSNASWNQYVITNKSGEVICYYKQQSLSIVDDSGISTLTLENLSSPQNDRDKFAFLQMIVEVLSGESEPNLSLKLMHALSVPPNASTSSQPAVRINTNASYALQGLDIYGNSPDNTWNLSIGIKYPIH